MAYKDRVTDEQLEERVRATLDREPRIENPRDVAITVAAGAATLRGTLPSFKQRHAAVQAAKKVGSPVDLGVNRAARFLGSAC